MARLFVKCLRTPLAGVLLLATVLISVTSGCTSSSFVRYERSAPVDPKTDGRYKVTGYMHARDWTTTLFVVLPLGSDLDRKSSKAIATNAGAMESVALHVENYTINPALTWAHYGGFIPYIIGTKCNYISATHVEPFSAKNTAGL